MEVLKIGIMDRIYISEITFEFGGNKDSQCNLYMYIADSGIGKYKSVCVCVRSYGPAC